MWSRLFYKTGLSVIIIFIFFGIPLTAFQSGLAIKEGVLKIGSADIYYKTMGNGTPTFILHGGPGDTHDTMLQLSPLGNDFKLIFYDQRAAGRSTGDADTASHTIDQFVEDLEQLRLKLGADKFNLIGGSWGSMVAMQYAMKYSEHIQAMVLMSSMGIRSEYFTFYQANIESKRTPEDSLALERIQNSEGFQSRAPDEVEKYWRVYFRAYCCNPTCADNLHLWMRNNDVPEVPGRYVKLGEFIADYDLEGELRNIKCPTLILHGACDPTPVEWVVPIHEKIVGSQLQTIPNAGHWLWVEGADQVIPKIKDFFNENKMNHEVE
jgi:proline iminopeptidase